MSVNLNASTRLQAQQAGFGEALRADLQQGGADAAATLRQLRDYIQDSKGRVKTGDIRIVNTTNRKDLAFSFKSFGWDQQYRKDRTAQALVTLLQQAGVADAQRRVDTLLKPDGEKAYRRLSSTALHQLLQSSEVQQVLDGGAAPVKGPAAPSPAPLNAAGTDAQVDALRQQIQLLKADILVGAGAGGAGGNGALQERLDARIVRAGGAPQPPSPPSPAPAPAPAPAPPLQGAIQAPVAAPPVPAQRAPALNPNQTPKQQMEAFLQAQGFQFSANNALGEGGYGMTFVGRQQGRDQVIKLFLGEQLNPNRPAAFKEEKLTGKRATNALSELYAAYLTRSGSNPNWQAPKVIAPTAYLVRSNSPEGFESIPVDQVKARARQTKGGLKCVGLVMARAPGDVLVNHITRGGLPDHDLKRATRSGLQTLRSLNERGFIHRDIKPANLSFDQRSGELHFFDTGAMFKAHKKGQDARMMTDRKKVSELPYPKVGTHGFTNREYVHGDRMSSQADLHALTLTLLQAKYPALGARTLLSAGPRSKDEFISAGDFTSRLRKLQAGGLPGAQAAAATFLAEVNQPNSYAHFIVTALNKADSAQIPVAQWANRALSNRHLEELMAHPALQ